MASITTLFVDIGGVLLSNGWDHHARERAAAQFKLDYAEMDARHRAIFASYEEGKVTLNAYLDWTVFHAERAFSRDDIREFMFAQSKPHPDMIALVSKLKSQHRLRVVVVSNEARELNDYRIAKFKLDEFVDVFVSSCFVGIRKPDAAIFGVALDLTQVAADRVLYIENTAMFVDVATSLGIQSILHTDYASTCRQIAALRLLNDGVRP